MDQVPLMNEAGLDLSRGLVVVGVFASVFEAVECERRESLKVERAKWKCAIMLERCLECSE